MNAYQAIASDLEVLRNLGLACIRDVVPLTEISIDTVGSAKIKFQTLATMEQLQGMLKEIPNSEEFAGTLQRVVEVVGVPASPPWLPDDMEPMREAFEKQIRKLTPDKLFIPRYPVDDEVVAVRGQYKSHATEDAWRGFQWGYSFAHEEMRSENDE